MAVNSYISSYEGEKKSVFNRHIFLILSVLFHIVLAYGLSHVRVEVPVLNPVDRRVKISMDKTYRMKMNQSLKNIAQIQDELVNTLDESLKKNIQLEPIAAHEINDPTLSTSRLMELANKISENIRKIEREFRIQDLQRAVTMSRDDVMKQVMTLEIALPQYSGNRIPGSTMVKLAEAIEAEAKNILDHRENDIRVRGVGNSILEGKKSDKLDLAYYSLGDPNLKKRTGVSLSESNAQKRLHSKNEFVDLWLDYIPPVDQVSPKKVAGRIIKNSGQPADRLFVNSWYIIGPFPISNSKYPPDYAIDLDGVYYGKNNHTVTWRYLSSSQYPVIPPQLDKAGVFFGYTEVFVEREQDLWIWVGGDDFVSLELNNRLIWESHVFNKKFNDLAYDPANIERNNWNLTEHKRHVHFKAGRNIFKFKLTNSDATAFFSLVLTR